MATFKLTDTYLDYFSNYAAFNEFMSIKSKQEGRMAQGAGAIRQYINLILDSMLNANLIELNGFFLKFNTKTDYLHCKTRMEAFGKLISINLKVNGTLPFHLNPCVLEIALGPMELPILEYFYDKMYPTMSKILETNYETTCRELGYTASEGYLRDKLLHHVTPLDWLLASTLRSQLNSHTSVNRLATTHIDLDQTLSGEYQITHQMVLKVIQIDTIYKELWTQFVHSIPQAELPEMLYYFTNSKSCDQLIKINVSTELQSDIKIETCFGVVNIAEMYFKDLDSLKMIKGFWSGSEYKMADISDGNDETLPDLTDPINWTLNPEPIDTEVWPTTDENSSNENDVVEAIRQINVLFANCDPLNENNINELIDTRFRNTTNLAEVYRTTDSILQESHELEAPSSSQNQINTSHTSSSHASSRHRSNFVFPSILRYTNRIGHRILAEQTFTINQSEEERHGQIYDELLNNMFIETAHNAIQENFEEIETDDDDEYDTGDVYEDDTEDRVPDRQEVTRLRDYNHNRRGQ